MNAAATVALFVGLVAGVTFLVLYWIKVPGWWREVHRAHVVSFVGVIVGFFLLYVLRPLVPAEPFQWVRLVLLWMLSLAVVWRLAIFLAGLRRDRSRRRG
jgi:uncharacterized membrane protein YfcA